MLLLGAGASKPFNIPLGGELLTDIKNQLDKERAHFNLGKRRRTIDASQLWEGQHLDSFFASPIHYTAISESTTFQGGDVSIANSVCSELEALNDRLAGQTSETIDDFIVQNPSLAPIAKICAAAIIFMRSYELSKTGIQCKPFESRNLGLFWPPERDSNGRIAVGERNWIHHLINIVRDKRVDNPKKNSPRIKIITFNYDTILEYVLEQQFSNTEIEYGSYTDHFEIIHPHGKFNKLQKALTSKPHTEISEWAKKIVVARGDEVTDTEVSEARVQAKIMVANCTNLHCAGFAFAGANTRLLGLHGRVSPSPALHVNFCNYNGNVALTKIAKKLSEKTSHPAIYVTPDEPPNGKTLSITDWFASGYAGELPT